MLPPRGPPTDSWSPENFAASSPIPPPKLSWCPLPCVAVVLGAHHSCSSVVLSPSLEEGLRERRDPASLLSLYPRHPAQHSARRSVSCPCHRTLSTKLKYPCVSPLLDSKFLEDDRLVAIFPMSPAPSPTPACTWGTRDEWK